VAFMISSIIRICFVVSMLAALVPAGQVARGHA